MSDNPKLRKFLKFILVVLPLIFLAMCAIGYVALKMVERYPVPLKTGLEEYLSESTGMSASIQSLNNFTFVPALQVELEEIRLMRRGNMADVRLRIGQVDLALPFTSMFFGLGHVSRFEMRDVKIEKGLLTPYETVIENVMLDRENQNISGRGNHAGKPMTFNMAVNVDDDTAYLDEQTPFSVEIGGRSVEGILILGGRDLIQAHRVIYAGAQSTGPAEDYILFDQDGLREDNPLYCLLYNPVETVCDRYLTGPDVEDTNLESQEN